MIAIKNYDSRNSISTYAFGDVCACYINNVRAGEFIKANNQDVKKYAKTLNKAIKENARLVGGNGKYHKLTRAIGVVVDKIKASQEYGLDMITVMFKTTEGNYVLNKYAVGTNNVLTNGKNYVLPTTKIDFSTNE